jgi:hypothetical protein
MKVRLLLCVFFALPGVIHVRAAAAADDPLQGLDFLLGEWGGRPPSHGGDVFRRDLDGKVIVRNAQADAGDGANSVMMKMSMTIYNEPGNGLLAIYFDNDGHVIHYKLSALVPGRSVQFDSEAAGPGPRFRLTYSASGKDQLAVRFEMAPPGEHAQYQVIAAGIDQRIMHQP